MKGPKPETFGKIVPLLGAVAMLAVSVVRPAENSGVVIDTGSGDSAPKAGKNEDSMGSALSIDGTKLEVVIARPTPKATPRPTNSESLGSNTVKGTLNGRTDFWAICDKVGPLNGGITCSKSCVNIIKWAERRPVLVAVKTGSCAAVR